MRLLLILLIALITSCAGEIKKERPPIVWPLPPDPPRIEFIENYYGERDLRKIQWYETVFGEDPSLSLKRPFCAVPDREGNIYVSDVELKGVFKFDFKNRSFRLFYPSPRPLSMDIMASKNLLFVTDGLSKQVIGISLIDGRPAIQLPGDFKTPGAVRVDEKHGRIYVGDSRTDLIWVYDLDGRFLFKFGGSGMEKGQFLTLTSIDVDSQGRIYVADSFNYRIQVFDMEGNYLRSLGYGVGKQIGAFARLKGVAIDSEDHVYALDMDHSNVQIFDFDNNMYLFFSGLGTGDGSLWFPTCIYIDRTTDMIYIGDNMNRRVSVFRYIKQQ
jgi:DNA-binding beta-propeller fold protein YncE